MPKSTHPAPYGSSDFSRLRIRRTHVGPLKARRAVTIVAVGANPRTCITHTPQIVEPRSGDTNLPPLSTLNPQLTSICTS